MKEFDDSFSGGLAGVGLRHNGGDQYSKRRRDYEMLVNAAKAALVASLSDAEIRRFFSLGWRGVVKDKHRQKMAGFKARKIVGRLVRVEIPLSARSEDGLRLPGFVRISLRGITPGDKGAGSLYPIAAGWIVEPGDIVERVTVAEITANTYTGQSIAGHSESAGGVRNKFVYEVTVIRQSESPLLYTAAGFGVETYWAAVVSTEVMTTGSGGGGGVTVSHGWHVLLVRGVLHTDGSHEITDDATWLDLRAVGGMVQASSSALGPVWCSMARDGWPELMTEKRQARRAGELWNRIGGGPVVREISEMYPRKKQYVFRQTPGALAYWEPVEWMTAAEWEKRHGAYRDYYVQNGMKVPPKPKDRFLAKYRVKFCRSFANSLNSG